ncbi:MAG: DUF4080 domain-containing protein, partial [Clostridiales bacterium]|nr:DUF4080 domain-containing protein [Clostridiales bacterium]
HFEISADLLDEDMLAVLSTAREGLFQLETGIQSTNIDTLSAVTRKTDLDKIYDNVKRIKSFGNMHQHLDLIAGLPYEGILSFKRSFNDVYSLRPDMLQLGFLKLLKGSALREKADLYEMLYSKKAPYEILKNKWLNYDDTLKLKDIEHLVEIYYNSGMFKATLEYGQSLFDSPFDMLNFFTYYWDRKNLYSISNNKNAVYSIIYNFLGSFGKTDVLKNLLKFDMYSNENVKNPPDWIENTDYSQLNVRINEFYSNEENIKVYFGDFKDRTPRQMSRINHIERFDYDITGFLENGVLVNKDTFILFVYPEGKNKKTKIYNVHI